MRSYTSTVPLFVQTLSKEAMVQIKPFLDPAKDMVISLEDVRFSLLAISVVCPGASTLIGNILRSTVPPRPTFLSQDTMAGMRVRTMSGYYERCLHAHRAPFQAPCLSRCSLCSAVRHV